MGILESILQELFSNVFVFFLLKYDVDVMRSISNDYRNMMSLLINI